MGRRSVNTTKSGKYMNPTDQARKEARKRELKKNKKQRTAVRQAVLKSKDPLQLLQEADIYDKQEYDPEVPAQLTDRVIQEKRKKLLETFDRLIILYRKEDGEYADTLQAARKDYDQKRHELILHYEQVKLAERVKASDIPLPDLPADGGISTKDIPLPVGAIPLPPSAILPPVSEASSALLPPGIKEPAKSILKKDTLPQTAVSEKPPAPPPGLPPHLRHPPGPPPGPPPELSDSDSEDDLGPPGTALGVSRHRKIRFQDDDSYNPETMFEKDTRIRFRRPVSFGKDRAPGDMEESDSQALLSADGFIDDGEGGYSVSGMPSIPHGLFMPRLAGVGSIPRPLPPGPPPHLPNLGLPQMMRPGMPIPPGRIPLPSLPPPRLPPGLPQLPGQPEPGTVLSAPPSLLPNRPKPGESGGHLDTGDQHLGDRGLPGPTTIVAKPQLKNLIGDSTKFVPTALRIKRTMKDIRGRTIHIGGGTSSKESGAMYERSQAPTVPQPSKDDAYDQFMKEMDELL